MTQAALATPVPTSTPKPPTATPVPTATPLPAATATKANTPTQPSADDPTKQASTEITEDETTSTRNQSPLFWQITAGVELAALLVIIGVFWQPWKTRSSFR